MELFAGDLIQMLAHEDPRYLRTEKKQQKYLYQVHAAHPRPPRSLNDVMLDDTESEEMSESDEYVFERIVRTRLVPVPVAAAPKRSQSHKKKKMQVRSEIEYLLQWYGNCKFESSPGHVPECDNYKTHRRQTVPSRGGSAYS